MADDVAVVTVLSRGLILIGKRAALVIGNMQPLFQVGDNLGNGAAGDDGKTCHQRGFIGTIEGDDQMLPPHLAGLDGHGQYSVKADKRSGGADSSDKCNVLPPLLPWLDLSRFNQHADEHGKIEVCTPLLDVAGTEVDHDFPGRVGISHFLGAGFHPVLCFLDGTVPQPNDVGGLQACDDRHLHCKRVPADARNSQAPDH